MLIDLAINPFDADVADMVSLARVAEAGNARCVWVADHFSGAVVGRSWSRDPFVCLGAIAASTARIDVGVLVANVVNRHPVQLASAVNSLQSIAPGRVRLGIGSGAAPGSRFAIEHEAIGRRLGDDAERRAHLVDSLAALRAIWREQDGFVVDESPMPPVIIGASAWATVAVALEIADGVNLRRTDQLLALLERIGRQRPDGFEVSVLEWFDDVADNPELADRYAALGVDRLVLGISPPHAGSRLARFDFSRL